MDGYSKTADLVLRYGNMKDLFEFQLKLNSDLSKVTNEMNSLPNLPDNMEDWIDSLSDLESDNNFKLSDFKKVFKCNKQYNDLLELRSENSQKIKILVIDNLIDRIKLILSK